MKWIVLCCAFLKPLTSVAQTAPELGGKLFFQSDKGHCIACHHLPNDVRAAAISPKPNIGAAFEGVAVRYPDRTKLREIIWDASVANPNTIMPPYGKHLILSEGEIDALVDFLLTQ